MLFYVILIYNERVKREEQRREPALPYASHVRTGRVSDSDSRATGDSDRKMGWIDSDGEAGLGLGAALAGGPGRSMRRLIRADNRLGWNRCGWK
jgi:hypothetical protein